MTSYPAAHRLDLVEDLHGRQVADPYRWLEDAADPETEQWSTAQDALYAAHRDRLDAAIDADGPLGTGPLTARLQALLGAGFVGTPAWRGDRRFFSRRTGEQEHAVVVVAEPDPEVPGTERERVLIDPIAIDPAGTTTLDAWQPSKEGDLLAYQVSHGGTEESVLHVLDVATGARPSTARSIAPGTRRWRGSRAARPSSTCGGWPPSCCPPTSSSTTAGCGATWSAPTRRPTSRSWATAWT
jgi:prolyl oligopeptidase